MKVNSSTRAVPVESTRDGPMASADGRCVVSNIEFGIRTPTATRSAFASGATAGVGSLPHLDATAAAAFAIGEFDIATIPSLPRRCVEETAFGQAVLGVEGVRIDDRGDIVVDPGAVQPNAAITTDVASNAFGGMRAFLELARKVRLDGSAVNQA